MLVGKAVAEHEEEHLPACEEVAKSILKRDEREATGFGVLLPRGEDH